MANETMVIRTKTGDEIEIKRRCHKFRSKRSGKPPDTPTHACPKTQATDCGNVAMWQCGTHVAQLTNPAYLDLTGPKTQAGLNALALLVNFAF